MDAQQRALWDEINREQGPYWREQRRRIMEEPAEATRLRGDKACDCTMSRSPICMCAASGAGAITGGIADE